MLQHCFFAGFRLSIGSRHQRRSKKPTGSSGCQSWSNQWCCASAGGAGKSRMGNLSAAGQFHHVLGAGWRGQCVGGGGGGGGGTSGGGGS